MNIKPYRNDEESSDLKVTVDDATFNVHNLILSDRSGYFKENAKGKHDISLSNFPGGAEIFKLILDHIYDLPIDIPTDKFVALREGMVYLKLSDNDHFFSQVSWKIESALSEAKCKKCLSVIVEFIKEAEDLPEETRTSVCNKLFALAGNIWLFDCSSNAKSGCDSNTKSLCSLKLDTFLKVLAYFFELDAKSPKLSLLVACYSNCLLEKDDKQSTEDIQKLFYSLKSDYQLEAPPADVTWLEKVLTYFKQHNIDTNLVLSHSSELLTKVSASQLSALPKERVAELAPVLLNNPSPSEEALRRLFSDHLTCLIKSNAVSGQDVVKILQQIKLEPCDQNRLFEVYTVSRETEGFLGDYEKGKIEEMIDLDYVCIKHLRDAFEKKLLDNEKICQAALEKLKNCPNQSAICYKKSAVVNIRSPSPPPTESRYETQISTASKVTPYLSTAPKKTTTCTSGSYCFRCHDFHRNTSTSNLEQKLREIKLKNELDEIRHKYRMHSLSCYRHHHHHHHHPHHCHTYCPVRSTCYL